MKLKIMMATLQKDVVKNNPKSDKCSSSESSNMFHYMLYVGVKTSKIVYSYLRLHCLVKINDTIHVHFLTAICSYTIMYLVCLRCTSLLICIEVCDIMGINYGITRRMQELRLLAASIG